MPDHDLLSHALANFGVPTILAILLLREMKAFMGAKKNGPEGGVLKDIASSIHAGVEAQRETTGAIRTLGEELREHANKADTAIVGMSQAAGETRQALAGIREGQVRILERLRPGSGSESRG